MFGITNSICGVKAKFIEFGKKDKNSWKNSKNKVFLAIFSKFWHFFVTKYVKSIHKNHLYVWYNKFHMWG